MTRRQHKWQDATESLLCGAVPPYMPWLHTHAVSFEVSWWLSDSAEVWFTWNAAESLTLPRTGKRFSSRVSGWLRVGRRSHPFEPAELRPKTVILCLVWLVRIYIHQEMGEEAGSVVMPGVRAQGKEYGVKENCTRPSTNVLSRGKAKTSRKLVVWVLCCTRKLYLL